MSFSQPKYHINPHRKDNTDYRVTTIKEITQAKIIARETHISMQDVPQQSLDKLALDTNPANVSLNVKNLTLSMQKSPENVDKAIDLSTKCIGFLKQKLEDFNHSHIPRSRRMLTAEDNHERPFARAFSIDVTPTSPAHPVRAKSRDAIADYNPANIKFFKPRLIESNHNSSLPWNKNSMSSALKDLYEQEHCEAPQKRSARNDSSIFLNTDYQNAVSFSLGATAVSQTNLEKSHPPKREYSIISTKLPSRVSGLTERESGEYNIPHNSSKMTNNNATNSSDPEATPEKPENPSNPQPLRTNPALRLQSHGLSPTNPRYLDMAASSTKQVSTPLATGAHPWMSRIVPGSFTSNLEVITSTRRLKTDTTTFSSYKSREDAYNQPLQPNVLTQKKHGRMTENEPLGLTNSGSQSLLKAFSSRKGDGRGPLQMRDLYESPTKQISFESPHHPESSSHEHHYGRLHTEVLTTQVPFYTGQSEEKGTVVSRLSFDNRSEVLKPMINRWEDPKSRVASEGLMVRDIISGAQLRGLSSDNMRSPLVVNHVINLDISKENKENLERRLYTIPGLDSGKDFKLLESTTPLGLSQKNGEGLSVNRSRSNMSVASQQEIEKILDQKLRNVDRQVSPSTYTLLNPKCLQKENRDYSYAKPSSLAGVGKGVGPTLNIRDQLLQKGSYSLGSSKPGRASSQNLYTEGNDQSNKRSISPTTNLSLKPSKVSEKRAVYSLSKPMLAPKPVELRSRKPIFAKAPMHPQNNSQGLFDTQSGSALPQTRKNSANGSCIVRLSLDTETSKQCQEFKLEYAQTRRSSLGGPRDTQEGKLRQANGAGRSSSNESKAISLQQAPSFTLDLSNTANKQKVQSDSNSKNANKPATRNDSERARSLQRSEDVLARLKAEKMLQKRQIDVQPEELKSKERPPMKTYGIDSFQVFENRSQSSLSRRTSLSSTKNQQQKSNLFRGANPAEDASFNYNSRPFSRDDFGSVNTNDKESRRQSISKDNREEFKESQSSSSDQKDSNEVGIQYDNQLRTGLAVLDTNIQNKQIDIPDILERGSEHSGEGVQNLSKRSNYLVNEYSFQQQQRSIDINDSETIEQKRHSTQSSKLEDTDEQITSSDSQRRRRASIQGRNSLARNLQEALKGLVKSKDSIPSLISPNNECSPSKAKSKLSMDELFSRKDDADSEGGQQYKKIMFPGAKNIANNDNWSSKDIMSPNEKGGLEEEKKISVREVFEKRLHHNKWLQKDRFRGRNTNAYGEEEKRGLDEEGGKALGNLSSQIVSTTQFKADHSNEMNNAFEDESESEMYEDISVPDERPEESSCKTELTKRFYIKKTSEIGGNN